jgi:glycosyltransferase involved in cell wall biosynthesis
MRELLGICIPTYNRPEYLADLLACLAAEYRALPPELAALVRVYVSDNASPPATAEILARYAGALPLTSWRNGRNIGCENNCFRLIERTTAEYKWLIGDDDLLPPGALGAVLRLLTSERPGLVILRIRLPDGTPDGRFDGTPERFADFGAFVGHGADRNPALLVAVSLVSCHIIAADLYDLEYARQMHRAGQVPYSWLYGMFNRAAEGGRPVLVPREPPVILRDATARRGMKARAATTLPVRFNLGWFVRCYLTWLAARHGRSAVARWAEQEYPLAQVHPVAHRLLVWRDYAAAGLRRGLRFVFRRRVQQESIP